VGKCWVNFAAVWLGADVAGGSAEDQALLVRRPRGGGEVRHGRLLAAQVPSVGVEVQATISVNPLQGFRIYSRKRMGESRMKLQILLLPAMICAVVAVSSAAVAVGSPGSVPSDESASGTPLTLGKGAGGALNLNWSPSCSAMATNYAVYEGTLPITGTYTHAALNCSLGNTTTASIVPGAGSRYYLLVPATSTNEGVYGVSSGASSAWYGPKHLIPAAINSCRPQLIGSCDTDTLCGFDPSSRKCASDAACYPLVCAHFGCVPSSCFCTEDGWICDTDCNPHCMLF
jgi:hypothetical protein